jgi:hypothetical protein
VVTIKLEVKIMNAEQENQNILLCAHSCGHRDRNTKLD